MCVKYVFGVFVRNPHTSVTNARYTINIMNAPPPPVSRRGLITGRIRLTAFDLCDNTPDDIAGHAFVTKPAGGGLNFGKYRLPKSI